MNKLQGSVFRFCGITKSLDYMNHFSASIVEIIKKKLKGRKKKQQHAAVKSAIVAYQILRIRKMDTGTRGKREIIDALYVQLGNSESVRARAISKAQMIGGCLVVEKSEKVITSFNE